MTESAFAYPTRYVVAPIGEIDAVVRPPGSKSFTNRALIVAGLAQGESRIEQPLISDDTDAMRLALYGLGIRIDQDPEAFVVRSSAALQPNGSVLDAGASGTTARFVTAAATLATDGTLVDGTNRMRQRPIGALVEGLRQLGADIAYQDIDGFLPLRVSGGGLAGGTATLDASSSSQFVSAVLMAAARAERATLLRLEGPIVSRPYIDNTIDVMSAFGAQVGWEDREVIGVEPNGYTASVYVVEPDASAAVYPWAAAAVTGGLVRVDGLGAASTQPDMGSLKVLSDMGCDVEMGHDQVSVRGPDGLVGVDADMNTCPDAVLGLAVVAAFATSESVFRNIGNLRIKETDRLEALETELRRLGADATAGPDWLSVRPGPLRGATIETYDDHRMAMAFSIAGLVLEGVVIQDPGCVAKTWPGFFEWLETL